MDTHDAEGLTSGASHKRGDELLASAHAVPEPTIDPVAVSCSMPTVKRASWWRGLDENSCAPRTRSMSIRRCRVISYSQDEQESLACWNIFGRPTLHSRTLPR